MARLDEMRRASLPLLARVFGIRPFETDRLAIGDFLALVSSLVEER